MIDDLTLVIQPAIPRSNPDNGAYSARDDPLGRRGIPRSSPDNGAYEARDDPIGRR